MCTPECSMNVRDQDSLVQLLFLAEKLIGWRLGRNASPLFEYETESATNSVRALFQAHAKERVKDPANLLVVSRLS